VIYIGIIKDHIVREACRGCDVVFHVAAKPPPWGKYSEYYRTNVTGTRNVIEACKAFGVPRLVFTSTPSVIFNDSDMEGADESVPYPERYTAPYPKTKAIAEREVIAAAKSTVNTIVIRPHQIWGPEDPHFAPRLIARAKKMKRIGDGKNLTDTTYIENAVDAHLLAAQTLAADPALSGKVYFISQGDPVPLWDMIDAILNSAGLPPVRGSISHNKARTVGAILEFFYRTLHLPGEPQMTRFLADAVAKSHWFDISAARRDLAYTPRISTAEGLKRLAAWFQSEAARSK